MNLCPYDATAGAGQSQDGGGVKAKRLPPNQPRKCYRGHDKKQTSGGRWYCLECCVSDAKWRRHNPGAPYQKRGPKPKPALVRFISKVDMEESERVSGMGGCWIWKGYITPAGYGSFGIGKWGDGKVALAHVWAYTNWIGPVPEGLELDHLCRVRKCVNPNHLEAVTHYVNFIRSTSPIAADARALTCINGHPWSDENTHRRPDGSRYCRACGRRRSKEFTERQRAKREL